MKNLKLLVLILVLSFSFNINAQLTYVPDDGFEQFLINRGLDSGPLDDYVPTANIDTVTSLIIQEPFNPPTFYIESIVGIEDFIALNKLILGNIHIYNDTIDLSNNLTLDTLIIGPAPGMLIQHPIYPTNLKVLKIYEIYYENIDLTGCPLLEEFTLNNTLYSNDIDFSNCYNLKRINLEFTGLKYLDVSFCPLLEYIDFGSSFTQIEYVNIKNGNNDNLSLVYSYNTWTPNVAFCVDDISSSLSYDLFTYFTFNTNSTITLSDVCTSNKITGTVLYDINNDGCATSTIGVPNYAISSTDGTNNFSAFMGYNQTYSVYTYQGTYQTTVSNIPSFLTANPNTAQSVFTSDYNIDTINFCVPKPNNK